MQQNIRKIQENTVAVLIPAYNPDQQLLQIAGQLEYLGFPVVIVDDGSSPAYASLFEQLKERAVILRNPCNLGKGAALKLGISYLRKHGQGLTGFVTADADGQHLVRDIVRVAGQILQEKTMILGTRDLKGNTPVRSRIGNVLSRFTFALVTDRYLYDNQTGLRGFSIDLCRFLEQVEGTHYEYEMNVLVQAVRERIHIGTIPIETVYNENNKTSHFKPLKDTCLIQFNMVKLSRWSVCFYILAAFFAVLWSELSWPAALFIAGGAFIYILHILVILRKPCRAAWFILIRYLFFYGLFFLIRWISGSAVCAGIIALLIFPFISYAMVRFRVLYDKKQ